MPRATEFCAERYQDGKCVSRQYCSFGKYSSTQVSKGSYRSVFSFGWNLDKQTLVGINDTGYYRQNGTIKLPDFHVATPSRAFFKESKPEVRKSMTGMDFNLYPIIGILGSKKKAAVRPFGSMPDEAPFYKPGWTHYKTSFLKTQADAVIVYLSVGRHRLPPLKEVRESGGIK